MIESIIMLAVQLIGWYLDWRKASDAVKKNFFESVQLAGQNIQSTKMMLWGNKQLEAIKKKPWTET